MAYLIDNPPARQQWYTSRRRPLTGCTVLHTSEGVLDSVGPDTGAEALADFIRRRATAGSYHDIADSDSWIPLIPYQYGAFHDGTGSNNWALSLSFACRTSDWRAMTTARRAGFLRQGALAFAAQQRWRKANGHPLTELRLIDKAASDRGESGFTYHGLRDPGRRTDPGVAAPNLFPLDEWLDHCRAALAGEDLEDDMPLSNEDVDLIWRKPALEGYGVPILILRSLQQQLAGLQAAVNVLAGAVGDRGGADADELRSVIREEMARVVDVQVSVRDDKPA